MSNPPSHFPVLISIKSQRPTRFPYDSALIPIPIPIPTTLSDLNSSIRSIIHNKSFGIHAENSSGYIQAVWSVLWTSNALRVGGRDEMRMCLRDDRDVEDAISVMAMRGSRDCFVVDVKIG